MILNFAMPLLIGLALAKGEKRVLKVAGATVDPYMNLEAIQRGKFPAGVDVDVLDIITKKLNYNYVINITRFPTMRVNGTWFGGIGELVEGRADVGIGHISLLHPRFRFVDMAYPMYISKQLLMAVKARPLEQHFNLVKAFSPILWLLLAFATLAVCLLKPFMPAIAVNGSKMTFVESLMLVIGIILHQGQSFAQKQMVSTRILIVSWLTFSTFIWLAFETDLLSYLISVDYEREINTVDDIIFTGRPLYIFFGRPSVNVMGLSKRKSNQQVMAKAHEDETYVYWPPDPRAADILATIKENYGIIVAPMPVYKDLKNDAIQEFGFNPFRLGTETIYKTYIGLAFPKGSKLRKEFQRHLKHLVAGGIVDRLFVKNLPLEKNEGEEETVDVPLNLQHFSLSFAMLAMGLIFAIMIFVKEIREDKKKKPLRAELAKTKVILVNEANKEVEKVAKKDNEDEEEKTKVKGQDIEQNKEKKAILDENEVDEINLVKVKGEEKLADFKDEIKKEGYE